MKPDDELLKPWPYFRRHFFSQVGLYSFLFLMVNAFGSFTDSYQLSYGVFFFIMGVWAIICVAQAYEWPRRSRNKNQADKDSAAEKLNNRA
jgi:Na+/melibiose symporter-like transporter